MIEENYPSILVRVKSIIADYLFMLIFMIAIAFVFRQFENVNSNLRIAAFLFAFVFYDPLFISVFGGTIGHKMNGICVKRIKNHQKNIIFPLAVIRFFVKAVLGFISLITIVKNEERRAIHDYVSGSIVLYENELND